jgi:hypothetical protein
MLELPTRQNKKYSIVLDNNKRINFGDDRYKQN